MTRLEIETTFENDIEQMSNTQISELTTLATDDRFAHEAGEEFCIAVSVVGLHRVLA